MMTRKAWLGAFVTCLLGASCAKGGEAESTEATTIADTPPSMTEGNEPQANAQNQGTPAYGAFAPGTTQTADVAQAEPLDEPRAPATESLTDEQIAKITEVVDTGELEQAEMARKRAKNAQVKQYASHMISQHKASKRKNTKLVKQQKIEPSDSETSNTLVNEASRTLETLKESETTNFDAAYISAQVKQHQSVYDLLDRRLIPSAASTELKSRLEETRDMVGKHLEEAQKIQESLASADAR